MKRLLTSMLALALMLILGIGATSAQNATWQITYYDDSDLATTPVGSQVISSLNINWGENAPLGGMEADYWSMRAVSTPYFNGGNYEFSVRADDAFRLYIDGQLVMDTWNDPKAGQTLKATTGMSAGNHTIQVEFREFAGVAYLDVSWQQVTTSPPSQPPIGGTWFAEYYNNKNLSGSPTVTFNETTPSHNWGTGQPTSGINADQFSVRWTKNEYVTAGNYRVRVYVDDGARVYINGNLVIDKWFGSPQITERVADVQLNTGYVNFVVEYYDEIGIARLDYSFTPITSQPPPNPTGAYLTINTDTLNVRAQPYVADNVVAQVEQGQTYSIIGRNSDSSWWQIENGNQQGWVSSGYVLPYNTGNVPVTWQGGNPNPPQPPVNNAYLTVDTGRLNVRAQPYVADNIIAKITQGENYSIVGRNSDASWWQIQIGNQQGWVSGAYVIDYNTSNVPTTWQGGNPPPPTPQPPVANAYLTVDTWFLNVRAQPYVADNRLGTIARNESFSIVGRNSDSSWWQIQYGNVQGWVNGSYTLEYNTQNVPVTFNTQNSEYNLYAIVYLNIRTGPSTAFPRVGVLRPFKLVPILGRNNDASWWYINDGGTSGWVSNAFVTLPGNISYDQISVRQQ